MQIMESGRAFFLTTSAMNSEKIGRLGAKRSLNYISESI